MIPLEAEEILGIGGMACMGVSSSPTRDIDSANLLTPVFWTSRGCNVHPTINSYSNHLLGP